MKWWGWLGMAIVGAHYWKSWKTKDESLRAFALWMAAWMLWWSAWQ